MKFKYHRHTFEWAVDELIRMIPGLSRQEAEQRRIDSKKLYDKRVAAGICTNCGVEGHTEQNCRLKIEGENELAREANRRACKK